MNYVIGLVTVILVVVTGAYLTLTSGFFQIRYFKNIFNKTIFARKKIKKGKESSEESNGWSSRDKGRGITPFQAVSTSLAATFGTGNIAGVSFALIVGGPGAVFWMWVSAILGMMTIFAENVLTIRYRKCSSDSREKEQVSKQSFGRCNGEWNGGPMYYIKYGLREKYGKLSRLDKYLVAKISTLLACMFSIFCILASFGIGNMTQINTMAATLKHSYNVPEYLTGAITVVISSMVILGGIKRLASVTEKLVPFMAITYIVSTLIIIIINIDMLPECILEIFRSAPGTGCVGGYAFSRVIMTGIRRGIFSNEAGLGSTVIASAQADVKDEVTQGFWGMFEVFVGTMIVCTMTALALMTGSGGVNRISEAHNGMELLVNVFTNNLGSKAMIFLVMEIILFAFSTIIGWSFYGAKCVEFLFGEKHVFMYRCVFICAIMAGGMMDIEMVWGISDLLNGLMAIPNLIAVLLLSSMVINTVKRSERGMLKNSGKNKS